MAEDRQKPEDDRAEGSREVVDDDLDEQAAREDRAEKERDTQRPPSHPPREDKELGPKGVP
jgi:hypothetical protein